MRFGNPPAQNYGAIRHAYLKNLLLERLTKIPPRSHGHEQIPLTATKTSSPPSADAGNAMI